MEYIKRFTVLILLVGTFISCSSPDKNKEKSLIIESESHGVTLTIEQFESSNMLLGQLLVQPFSQSIKTFGMFEAPPESKASVSAYFEGYVKELKLLIGQKVNKGQVLFTLENPAYIEVQQNFLEAKGQLKYLKSDYERQKNLAEDNVTSQKNYLKAEADYEVTLAQYEGLKKKLTLMNLNPDQITGSNITTEIQVVSPLSGYVTAVNASKGVFLNPDDIAVSIIDTDHLHIELNIFEKDLPKVKIGQTIIFKRQDNSSLTYEAEVYLVSKFIDSYSRTAAIHGHLIHEKDEEIFAPGMYIEAEILTTTDTLPALPEEAVISLNENNYVLLKLEQDANVITFEKRFVKVGVTKDGFVEILNAHDFNEQDKFLVKGAFNLISE